MKWAFIDYENICTLEPIDISSYRKVVIFMGATQEKLNFGKVQHPSPFNINIVQIKDIGGNNLDFHLSYYLGLSESKAPKEVAFDVISNDNGYLPLIRHIRSKGRECNHIKFGTEVNKFIGKLRNQPMNLRPQKVASLRNHIASQMNLKGNETAIQNQMNQLVTQNVIVIKGSDLTYTI